MPTLAQLFDRVQPARQRVNLYGVSVELRDGTAKVGIHRLSGSQGSQGFRASGGRESNVSVGSWWWRGRRSRLTRKQSRMTTPSAIICIVHYIV